MPEENTDNQVQSTTTSDETVLNTDAQQSSGAAITNAADVDTAETRPSTPQTPKERTFTQKDVDAMFKRRLEAAVKTKLKEMLGDESGNVPDVKELQQQLTDYQQKTRTFEAKEAIRDFMSDNRNKTQVRPESARLVENLVLQKIDFDDTGKPINLKEAIEAVKSEASPLFITATTNINGYTGTTTPAVVDMNTLIRQTAGRG